MILSREDQREAKEPERIGRKQISRRGEGQQVTGGAFNLEGACYFRYCLNVVCFYTDLKMKPEKHTEAERVTEMMSLPIM